MGDRAASVLPGSLATISCSTVGFPVTCTIQIQWAENARRGQRAADQHHAIWRRRPTCCTCSHETPRQHPVTWTDSERGFTLVELMIAIVIGLFLTGGLLTLVQAMKRTARSIKAGCRSCRTTSAWR